MLLKVRSHRMIIQLRRSRHANAKLAIFPTTQCKSSICRNFVKGGATYSTLTDYNSRVRSFEEIPGPRPIPGLGVSYKYFPGREYASPDRVVSDKLKHREYGDLVREEIFPGVCIVHVYNPDDVEKVYRADGKFPERAVIQAYHRYTRSRGLARSLVNSKGPQWLQRRSGVNKQMMLPASVAEYIPALDVVADDLVQLIRTSPGGIQVNAVMQRYTMEALGVLVFNRRLHALSLSVPRFTEELLSHIKLFFPTEYNLAYTWYHQYFPPEKWAEFVNSMDFVTQASSSHYNTCLQHRERESLSAGLCPDLVEELITCTEGDKSVVTDVMNNLLLGGLDNTTNIIHYVLYNLAVNPMVQDRLYDELCGVLTQDATSMSKHTLDQMSYLKAVVKETFRLTPVVPAISRINSKQLQLQGYRIPPGTNLLLHSAVPCHDIKYVADPGLFQPERWLKSSQHSSLHPFLLLPFGHGPRICLGKRFAEQEVFIAIAKLIRNFRVSYTGPEIEFVTRIVNYPKNDQIMEFTDRHAGI